jgi:IS605 OrfB family transposase
MFCSSTISCPECCIKHTRSGEVSYYHQVLGAVIVHPEQKGVIPLAPEPITRQDGRHYLGASVNSLPFDRIAAIGVEELHDMKRGKQKGRGKKFRKAMAPWTYQHVLNRIEMKAQENRVLLVRVDPANTSRTYPACGAVSKENRKGEKFLCVTCDHAGDADTFGAQNVLARTLATLGSVASPRL